MTDEQKNEDEQAAEEVEEQGKFKREDEEPAPEDSDDDGEVEDQRFVSDATLKRSIAPIAAALHALR